MIGFFHTFDLIVLGVYGGVLALLAIVLSRKRALGDRDYFLAGGSVPAWVAALSVLATTQSAATFLGAPDYGYRGDFTYLGATLASVLGAAVVARVLIPKFYAKDVATVYELLSDRFGASATRSTGAMFIVGRALAGGARLYLAAIALSMIFFGGLDARSVCVSAAALIGAAYLVSVSGGLRAIVWIDLFQVATYCAAAAAMLIVLLLKIHTPLPHLLDALAWTPEGQNKLRLFDLSWRWDHPFALPAIVVGLTLLNIGSFGLDQDVTQRLLACKNAQAGARGLYLSVFATIPVVAVFIAIGVLLYVVYNRADVMGGALLTHPPLKTGGADVTIFMRFILTEAPPGVRGLAIAGVMATAVGTAMSALNAMSSVLVQDFYRPWRAGRAGSSDAKVRDDVVAGRNATLMAGLGTLAVAVLSFYWQRSTNTPLLDFVLSIMNFAYAGLLGVFFTALFTKRGSPRSVTWALIAGFMVVVALQPAVAARLYFPEILRRLAFPWQLCIATLIAFLICAAPPSPRAERV